MLRRFVFFLTLLALIGCAPRSQEDRRLYVVATTPIVADVVQQIGGERVQVETLLPRGSDAHQYTPRPQDSVMLSKAQLVFANGAGLEVFLQPLLENAGATAQLIEVSKDVPLLRMEEEPNEGTSDQEEHAVDPHTWFDPNNVLIWVDTIVQALSQADPTHAAEYRQNAEAYKAQLRELDAWIRDQVAQIPPENRKLVTDHRVFGYFAQRYGFEQVGTVIASFSTEASPSAQELAALEEAIRAYGVKAIFVEEIGNQALAEQVSRDTGVRLVTLYHDLGPAGSEVDTYLKYMRYNVTEIVKALR
ncbi:MAG: metal ABC transporter substrate-binding protein [Anaerolineales bacterium]